MINWRQTGSVDQYKVFELFAMPVVYSLFEIILVSFSFLLCLQYVIKSQKMLYVIILTLLILQILFGGVFNDYFAWGRNTNDGENFNGVVSPIFAKGGLYPSILYWPTAILYPLFGPSQHLQSTAAFTEFHRYANDHFNFFQWINFDEVILHRESYVNEFGETVKGYVLVSLNPTVSKWNSLWILPFAHTLLFAGSAVVLSKYAKN